MNNGQMAKCIAYRGYGDLDIQFEDGTIVSHKTKYNFLHGIIANPNTDKYSSRKKSILGMANTMSNGQIAKCIAYRRSDDLDVQFEDGTIVKHQTKHYFMKGFIANPNYRWYQKLSNEKSCLGQKKIMNCGMEAVCIEYRGSMDIDVQFEDGTIVKHQTKSNFDSGKVVNPTLGKCYTTKIKSSVQGITTEMKCGMNATCLVYRNSRDIDIQFEDGTIVEHISKNSFISGETPNPKLGRYYSVKGNLSCLGETRTMNCGMNATCISYNNVSDIDVQFEDGTIITHRSKSDFVKGTISNPNLSTRSLPEAMVFYSIKKAFPDAISGFRPSWLINANTNKPMEIDIWIPSRRVGIEYDGVKWHSLETDRALEKANMIADSTQIDKLITILEKGSIPHHSKKHLNIQLENNSFGETYYDLIVELQIVVSNILKTLGYKGKVDILESCDFDFLRSKVRRFIYFELLEDESKTKITKLSRPLKFSERTMLGISKIMNNGMMATCIEDRGWNDITVRFDDGTEVFATRQRFKNKSIANPSLGKNKTQSNNAKIVGKKVIMNCGMPAICIVDNGSYDIKIQFDDGTIVKTTRQMFINGHTSNPSLGKQYVQKIRTSMKGETIIMRNGMKATCIEDRGSADIDIRFEDGKIVEHVQRSHFRRGNVKKK